MKHVVLFVLLLISFVVSAAATTNYDFSVRNPGSNIYAFAGTSNTQVPSSNSSPSSQLSSSNYDDIASNNNTYHDFINYTKNIYPATRYVIEIDEVANTVTELNIFWNGYGVNSKRNKPDGVVIYIWNTNSNRYDYVTQTTSGGVVELNQSVTSSLTNYIDSDNQVTVYVVSQEKTFNKGYNWIGTDYFRLSVTADISAIDHYQIIHDGNGLTCDAETVTIKACTNAFDGSCTLSTEAVTLDVKATGGSTLTDSISFTGSGTASLPYTTAETVALSLDNISIAPSNSNVCNDNSAGSCNMVFANAGFRFLSGGSGSSEVISNQIAGTTFPIRLQAVKNSNGVCTGLFTGNIAVKLAQENVTPSGTSGLQFSINGSDINKYPSINSAVSLNFGSDSIATIPAPYYKDAGQIRLQASYSGSGVALVGASQNFWVRPDQFVITAQTSGTNINGSTASSSKVHKAGEDFDLVVTAYNSLGTSTDNITKNYQQGQIQLKLTRVKPTIAGSVEGTLSYALGKSIGSASSPSFVEHTLTAFSNGKSSFNSAQFSEVGIINLDVEDINYGGQGASFKIQAAGINIGRFTPAYFIQTVKNSGSFMSTCDLGSTTFAYSGQKDDASQTKGTITYLTNPVLKIVAKNGLGITTQNYYQDSEASADDFMKLTASEINITSPSTDSLNKGIDLSLLPLTASMSTGILNQTATRGELEYEFSDSDHFYYQRSSNVFVAPFLSDIDFTVASIISATDNNISATTINNVTATTGISIRFGRLRLENSFGPETSNLPLIMKTEYYNGSDFVLNTDDQCTAFDASKVSLTNISLNPALTTVLGGNGQFTDGLSNGISLQATGANNIGNIGISYSSFDWLKYDWSNTDSSDDGPHTENPSAVASFGIFRGNDRIISWREAGN